MTPSTGSAHLPAGATNEEFPHYALPTYSSIRKSKASSSFYAYPFSNFIANASRNSSKNGSPTKRLSTGVEDQEIFQVKPDKLYPQKNNTRPPSTIGKANNALKSPENKTMGNIITTSGENKIQGPNLKHEIWDLFESKENSSSISLSPTMRLSRDESTFLEEQIPLGQSQVPSLITKEETRIDRSFNSAKNFYEDDFSIFEDFAERNSTILDVAANMTKESFEGINQEENLHFGSNDFSPLKRVTLDMNHFVSPDLLSEEIRDRTMIPVSEYQDLLNLYTMVWNKLHGIQSN
ncbi:hypothetical protein CANARDRAFT_26564 [[Candida] arabinofermentans NRRL YB-2248]|uniref:Uncharacterized protein n=1 Tax=[Candida] arabinofermentans NRRL YB-2248 TaxID=983967 RepID=A0A1E4T5V6_9ASCO|nr:hypothetical protein CANARDRAFT_26564 [[Candida] arabinofermentans NRRL YB-2248]